MNNNVFNVMENINFTKLSENAKTPKRATSGSAGYDLYACTEKLVVVKVGEIKKIPLKIAIEIPSRFVVAYIFSRSSMGAKYGVTMANSVGVIDSDYRGEISVLLINRGEKNFIINNHDRIAQMVFSPVFLPEFTEAKNGLSKTKRGTGGYGSTGIK